MSMKNFYVEIEVPYFYEVELCFPEGITEQEAERRLREHIENNWGEYQNWKKASFFKGMARQILFDPSEIKIKIEREGE